MPEKPAVRPVSSASSRPAHSGIVSPGSSLPPGSTQYGSLSGFWWRTRSRAPSRSTTAATRTPKSIPRDSRSLPMRRVYPRGDQGELRDVRRLFLLAMRSAEVRDLGLQLVAGLEHQAQTFVFGEMSVVGFEDTGLGGWVDGRSYGGGGRGRRAFRLLPRRTPGSSPGRRPRTRRPLLRLPPRGAAARRDTEARHP